VSETKLTRYERARIIGARALQISLGAPVLIDVDKGEPIDIAMMELEQGVIPITVKRAVKELKKAS
jgi:DNA-directed RNA polymerase subunit K